MSTTKQVTSLNKLLSNAHTYTYNNQNLAALNNTLIFAPVSNKHSHNNSKTIIFNNDRLSSLGVFLVCFDFQPKQNQQPIESTQEKRHASLGQSLLSATNASFITVINTINHLGNVSYLRMAEKLLQWC